MRSFFLELCYTLLLMLMHASATIHGFNLTTQSGEVKCIERERQALLKFTQGLLDDYGMLSTWRNDESNGDCCKWKGIKCSKETGHVQVLDLHGSESDIHVLIGTINISLLIELQNMEYLDLSSNFFSGSIPESLDNFSKLRYLNLSNCALGGRIPYQIGKLTNLEYLDLGDNDDIEGAIPYQIGNLSRLKYLNLGGNSLSGAIPFELRNLAQLRFLNLERNSLVGAIPFVAGDLPMLRCLKLGGNSDIEVKEQGHVGAEWLSSLPYLTNLDLGLHNLGRSPHWLQSISKLLPNLRELRLSRCNLADINIVSLFGSNSNTSTSLTILDLSSNVLTSSTFMWLCNFTSNLQELYLSDNNIVLMSPSSLYFPSLVILDLSNNKQPYSVFQGNFNFSSELQKLYLHNCGLSDRSFLLPSASNAKRLSSLIFLDLSDNLLISSTIFHWLFNFTRNLHVLRLSRNLLEGPIPHDFGNIMNSLELLNLYDNKLQGEIPSSLRNISTLQTFYLDENALTGMLPDLSTLSSLSSLSISNNQLKGEIPKSIGLLSKLQILMLDGNSLEGEVSEEHFTHLSNLYIIDLSHNSLTLKFDTSWVPPFQLLELLLESCKVGPSFPIWLRNQSNLVELSISNAGISDYLPKWFWYVSQNTYLMNISHNSLRGIIPNLPLNLASFPILVLTSNQFEGPIPPFLLKAVALHLSYNRFLALAPLLCSESAVADTLEILDVSNNELKGQLSDCWDHLKSLQYLDLSNNKLSGKVPLSMGALVNLKALVLRNNSLIGELPYSIKNLTNLILLDVSENKLSGTIPSWIGENLHQLAILSLRVNHFSRSLPSQLCYLTQIKLLDLSENHLSGQIPKCFHNFTVMTRISTNMSETASHNCHNDLAHSWYVFYISLMWKGAEDVFKNPELLLNSIHLSGNNLSGEIPTEIGSLFGLVSLNLSSNNLSGEISSNIGNLKSLEFLDLSRNHLSGKIPSSLSQIDRLSVLDLSNNHLIGRIPIGTQLQSFDASSYERNLNLCGKPLDKICPEDEMLAPQQVPIAFDHEDEESFFFEAFYMSLGLGFAVGFWGFMGPILVFHSWRYSYAIFLDRMIGSISW